MKKFLKLSAVTSIVVFFNACGSVTAVENSSTVIGEKSSKVVTSIKNSGDNRKVTLNILSDLNVSQPSDNLTEVTSEDMALSNNGNIVFLADGSAGLKIIDVSDSSCPKLIAHYDDPCDSGENRGGFARRIDISSDGNIIYIADGLAGLKIIDVSDPHSPSLMGKIDTKGFSHGLSVSSDGSTVYVTDNGEDGGTPGLRVIDVSNPYCPCLIAQRDEPWATQVVVSNDGKKVYVTDKKVGISVVDVSSSALLDFSDATLGRYTVIDKGISADIVLSSDGSKAYVSNKKLGIKILDISDALNPKLLGKYDSDGFGGQNVAKSIALSSDGKRLFVANRKTGVEVLDVSNPTSTKLLATVQTSSAEAVMLSKDGTKLYIADGLAGFKIISIDN